MSPLLALSLFIVNHQLSSRDFNTLGHLQPATFLLQLEAKSFINQSLILQFMNIMNIAENYHIPMCLVWVSFAIKALLDNVIQ